MQNYHIKQHKGHWDLTLEGAGRSAITRPTKAEIIQATQAFMDGKTAPVKIHGLTAGSRRSALIPGVPIRRDRPVKPSHCRPGNTA